MQSAWKVSFHSSRAFAERAWLELSSASARASLKKRAQEVMRTSARRVVQSGVAFAVDQAVDTFGLGRYGVRLSGQRDVYEAEIQSLSSVSMAEAAERLSMRAMADVFSKTSEKALVLNMFIRWFHPKAVGGSGAMRLTWSPDEREQFRREVLSRLTDGAELQVTAPVLSGNGLCVAEVEMIWKAWARPQIGREGES